jgi:hypothetical protein
MDDKRYAGDHVVPIEQEPRHHLIIANEFVRALAVEIAPHDRTLCHHHAYDYLLYVVGDAEIISAARDEEPKRLSYRDGECELLQAGMVHVVENLSDTPFRNIVVELLPAVGALRRGPRPTRITAEDDAVPLLEGTKVAPLFEDECAAIFSIQIEPGAEVEISGPAVVATPYESKLGPDALDDIGIKANPICNLAWIPLGREAVLWGCWQQAERVILLQIGRNDEEA